MIGSYVKHFRLINYLLGHQNTFNNHSKFTIISVWFHRQIGIAGFSRWKAQPATDHARSRRWQRRPGGKRVHLELRKGEGYPLCITRLLQHFELNNCAIEQLLMKTSMEKSFTLSYGFASLLTASKIEFDDAQENLIHESDLAVTADQMISVG